MGTFLAAFFGFFVFCFMALFFGVFGVIAFIVIAGLIALVVASSHAQALRVERLQAQRAQDVAWARYHQELTAWQIAHGQVEAPETAAEPQKLTVQRADGRKPWYLR